MSLRDLFRRRTTPDTDDTQLTEESPDITQRSTFVTLVEEYCRQYEDRRLADVARIAQLENENKALKEELESLRRQLGRVNAELITGRNDSGSAQPSEKTGEEASSSVRELLEIFKTKASSGDPYAQLLTGLRHALGIEGARNAILAEKWLTKAAVSGSASAALVLGVFKWHGICVDKGVQQALYWINEAYHEEFDELDELLNDVSEAASLAKQQRQRSLEEEKISRSYGRPLSGDEEFPAPEHDEQRASATNRAEIHERQEYEAQTEVRRPTGDRSKSAEWNLEQRQPPLGNNEEEIAKVRLPHNRSYSVLPEDEYGVVERKTHRLGRKIGRDCVRKARRFNRLMSRVERNFEPQEIGGLARRFAMRRGYTQHAIFEGMERLNMSDEAITPELRDIFIKAVKGAITNGATRGTI